jgi:ribosome-associated toxin RatA of RatAB toxin-antitoxin module
MNIDFTINLPVVTEKLFEVMIDYENYVNYLPQQIQKISIIDEKENETTVELTVLLSSIIQKKIIQRSIHRKKLNMLETEIISGPFKKSTIIVTFEKNNVGTIVNVKGDLVMPIKYKIFGLMIKKVYKNFITAILYKMMTEVDQRNNLQ